MSYVIVITSASPAIKGPSHCQRWRLPHMYLCYDCIGHDHAKGFHGALSLCNQRYMIQGVLSSLTSITVMQAAWLWWLDIDTAIVNLTRPLPLGDYEGRDLIGWGNYERLKAGDMMQGAFPENASLPTTRQSPLHSLFDVVHQKKRMSRVIMP